MDDPDRFILAYIRFLEKLGFSEGKAREAAILRFNGLEGKERTFNNCGKEVIGNAQLDSIKDRLRKKQKEHKGYDKAKKRVGRSHKNMTFKPSVSKVIPASSWIERMAEILYTLERSDDLEKKARAYRILRNHGFKVSSGVAQDVIDYEKTLPEHFLDKQGAILNPYPSEKRSIECAKDKFFGCLTTKKAKNTKK